MKPTVIRRLAEYKDERGNIIQYNGPVLSEGVKMEFRGSNNVLRVADTAEIARLNIVFEGSQGRCILGRVGVALDYPSSRFMFAAVIGDQSLIEVEDNTTTVGELSCRASHNCFHKKAQIRIGRDCMFSSGNKLLTTDYHPYFDALTHAPLNKEPVIVIGDHVWMGLNAWVMSGSVIGDGSIIGARSVVKGRMPNNCTIAGNPAQVRRHNVAWERLKPHYENKVSKQYYNATQPVVVAPVPSQQVPPVPSQRRPPVFRMLQRAWRRLKKYCQKNNHV
jgi:acetyltransferase-like isoleucine patch superfamily enzyme